MNKLTVIGNLTKNPELRKVRGVNGETAVLDFDVAVNGYRKGEKTVTYYRWTAWGKRAELIAQYTAKGSKIYLESDDEGPVAEMYTRKDGTTAIMMKATVAVNEFLDRKPEGAPAAQPANAPAAEPAAPADNDDLPF